MYETQWGRLSVELLRKLGSAGKSISQYELAHLLGINRSAVSHVETGRTPLSKKYREKYFELAQRVANTNGTGEAMNAKKIRVVEGEKIFLTAAELDKVMDVHSKKITRQKISVTKSLLELRGGVIFPVVHPHIGNVNLPLILPDGPTKKQTPHVATFLSSLRHVLDGGPSPTPYRQRPRGSGGPSTGARVPREQMKLPIDPPTKKEPVEAPLKKAAPKGDSTKRSQHYNSFEERMEALTAIGWALVHQLTRLADAAEKIN